MDQGVIVALRALAGGFPLNCDPRELMLPEIMTEVLELRSSIGPHSMIHDRLRRQLDSWLRFYRRLAASTLAARIGGAS